MDIDTIDLDLDTIEAEMLRDPSPYLHALRRLMVGEGAKLPSPGPSRAAGKIRGKGEEPPWSESD